LPGTSVTRSRQSGEAPIYNSFHYTAAVVATYGHRADLCS